MFKERQKKLDKEKKDVQALQEKFQKQVSVLSDKAKSKKQLEIQKKIMTIQQMTAQYQGEMQKKENEFKGPILKKISQIVEIVAKKNKYDVVFGLTTAPIYVNNGKDITNEVVEAYNKKHK